MSPGITLSLLILIDSLQMCLFGLINKTSGPFDVILDRYEVCPNELQPEKPTEIYMLRRKDRRHVNAWYYSINMTSYYPFRDVDVGQVRLSSWNPTGGWKENAHIFRFQRICSELRSRAPKLWRNLMKQMFGDPNRSCPIPAGNYILRDIEMDFSVGNAFPVFFYGKWRADLLHRDSRTNASLGCLRCFLETVPKTYRIFKGLAIK